MTPQMARFVIGLLCVTLWSCAWGASTISLPIKEAPIPADGSVPRWLDNSHVLFRTFPSDKESKDHPVQGLHRPAYVWNSDRGTVTREARFDTGGV